MKRCVECEEDFDESNFYPKRAKCKKCYSLNRGRKPKTDLPEIEETIITNPDENRVNYQLYNHLLRLQIRRQ